ncbi:MAG: type II secretion system protein [Verrucomicrobiales bacterium]
MKQKSAFTVVELLFSIGVILVLGTLMVAAYGGIQARVEIGACSANLRSLHAALGSYVTEHGSWPQIQTEEDFDRPMEAIGDGKSNEEFAEAWISILEPYGVTVQAWHCPTMKRESGLPDEELQSTIHYTPTQFDPHPHTPFQSPHQPWASEIGNAHGKGNLVILTNGAVRGVNEIFREQTGQDLE